MNKTLFFLLVLFGCRADQVTKDATVDAADGSETDTAPGTVNPPPDTDEPEPDTGPIGAWSSCSGTLTLDGSIFTWQSSSGDCTIGGPTEYAEPMLTLDASDRSSCPDLPWWLDVFESESGDFHAATLGTRLTLMPNTPLPSTRVAQFEEQLDIERWTLTSDDGVESVFALCWANDAFFDGGYFNVEGGCDFLSCAGGITAFAASETTEHWTTTCAGDCPCGGVVTVEERTDDTLSGRYLGANCARTLEGTFSGVRSGR